MRLEGAAYRRMWAKYYFFMIAPIFATLIIGGKLESMEAERLSRYRDKSALYGRKLAPGEAPSWPTVFNS